MVTNMLCCGQHRKALMWAVYTKVCMGATHAAVQLAVVACTGLVTKRV